MPTLADYLRLAPFNLDELVAATNGVLRGHPQLEVSRRTLRYYVTQGAIPPPVGPPKYARYEAEHLLRTVGVRALSARGRRIEEARRELDALLAAPVEEVARDLQGRVDALGAEAEPIQDMIFEPARPSAPAPQMRAASPPPPEIQTRSVLRLRLAPGIALELPGPDLDPTHLRRAADELQKILDSS